MVNFAAESHNDRAINDPSSFVYANAVGAQTLVEVFTYLWCKATCSYFYFYIKCCGKGRVFHILSSLAL